MAASARVSPASTRYQVTAASVERQMWPAAPTASDALAVVEMVRPCRSAGDAGRRAAASGAARRG